MAGIVGNRYFNDPALGQAFSNIAQMFAPPSGSDLAGYANANAVRQKAGGLAELFDYSKRAEGFDQTTFDRMGQAMGQWNPSNGYYGVNVGAATSRANNADDNARALEQTQMQEAGALSRLYAQPINVAENATVYLPEQTQKATGLSGILGGNISTAPGERVLTADGREINGQTKPMTDSELKAVILSQLPENEQRAAALAGVDVENVIGADGKTPEIVMRPDAAGRQPFVKPTNETMSPLARLLAERETIPVGDPRRSAYDQNIAALGRGQKQSKYDETTDEADAKLNEEISTNAMKSIADRGTYKTILAAVNNPSVDQGTAASAKLSLRKALNAFGFDAGDTAPAEMLNALGNQLSLRLRDPSSGAGMPGAMSDADRNFLQSMSIQLGNSPEANRLLAEYFMATQQKNIDMNNLRSDYVQKNGRVDEGFRRELAQYLAENDPTRGVQQRLIEAGKNAPPAPPVAPEQQPPNAGPPRAPIEPGTIEDGYRFRGGNPSDANNWEPL